MGRVMYFVVGVALVPEAILEKLEPMQLYGQPAGTSRP